MTPAETIQKQLKSRSKMGEFSDTLPPSPGASEAGGPATVFRRAKPGVLCFGFIYDCGRCDQWHGNIAGGFVISEDGLAVTNHHVVENDTAAAFAAMDSEGNVYPVVEVLASSERDDLAIVRLAGSDFKPVPLAASDAAPGAAVTAISHPNGMFYTVSQGIVSRLYRAQDRKRRGSPRLAITADFAKGSSGSPVFDAAGAAVGVVSSTNSIYYTKSEGIDKNLQMVLKTCIPVSALHKLLGK